MNLRGLAHGAVFGVVAALALVSISSASAASPGSSDREILDGLKKAASAGKGHKLFRSVKPRGTQKIKWWAAPGEEAREASSRSKTEWLHDGRFMVQAIRGKFLGSNFEAHCVFGYDTKSDEYQLSWTDTLSSRVFYSHGKFDKSGKTIELLGSYVDALTGKEREIKIDFVPPDKKGNASITVYDITGGGSGFKFLEIESKRFIAMGA